MANEALVNDISGGLRDPLLDAGKLLLELLDEDKKNIPITAAFWLLDSENRTWRYILASPIVDTEGPLRAYKIIHKIVRTYNESTRHYGEPARLTLQDITVVSPDEPVVDLLRTAVKTPPISISPVHFAGNSINNAFIDDAYIYRMLPNSPRDHSNGVMPRRARKVVLSRKRDNSTANGA